MAVAGHRDGAGPIMIWNFGILYDIIIIMILV